MKFEFYKSKICTDEEIQTNCLLTDCNTISEDITNTLGKLSIAETKHVNNDTITQNTKDQAIELIDTELSMCGKQYRDIYTVNLSHQDLTSLKESMRGKLTNLVVLDLSHNRLFHLPELLDFKSLKELNISHNKFATVPICLQYNFSKLVKLDMSHNALTVLHKPKCFPMLWSLSLNNNVKMKIPDWFWYQEFSCLTELNLSLTDPFFTKLPIWLLNHMELKTKGVFSNLLSLDMSNSGAVMSNVSQLKYLKRVKYLQCSNVISQRRGPDFVNVFWELPPSLLHLTSVQELHISNVQLNLIPEDLGNLVSLQVLNLSHNKLFKLPESIATLPALHVLDVSYNCIAILPDQMGRAVSLRTLHAQHNQMPELPAGFEALQLVYCDLYDNELEEKCVEVLTQMSTLHSLDVMQNYVNQDALPLDLLENLRASLPESEQRMTEVKIYVSGINLEEEEKMAQERAYRNLDAYSGYSSLSSSRSNSPTSSIPLPLSTDLDNSNWDDETSSSDQFNFYLVDEWQHDLAKNYEEAIEKFRTRQNACYFIPSDTQVKYFSQRSAVQKFDFLSLPTVEGQFDPAE